MKKTCSFASSFCILLITSAILIKCTPALHFSQQSLTQTTSVKQEALMVMDKATDNFQSHGSEVQTLRLHLQTMIESEKQRQKNESGVQMWQKLTDSTGNLLGGFLRRWEIESKLNKVFIDDKKTQVSAAFEQIIALENAKPKQ